MLGQGLSRSPVGQHDGKPGRLRAACTSCHAAKVRCSGEKTGCVRCHSLGHECIYLESRVGKTRGRRKRSAPEQPAQSNSQNSAPDPMSKSNSPSRDDSREAVTSSSASPAVSIDTGDFLQHDLWDIPQPISGSNFLGTEGGLQEMELLQEYTIPDMSRSSTDPAGRELGPDLGSSHDRQLDSAIGTSDEPHTFSPLVRSPPWRLENRSRTSGCEGWPQNNVTREAPYRPYPRQGHATAPTSKGVILAAAEILEELETKLRGGLTAIDEVLRVNKAATQAIGELMNRRDYTCSIGASIVILAAAQHAVHLFETACEELYPGLHRNRWSTPPDIPGKPSNSHVPALSYTPGIGFGSFPLDPEEQASLSARIISTELRRSLQMLRCLSSSPRPDHRSFSLHSWTQNLEKRMQYLISVVDNI
ncbi:hypothetical protein CNMCM5793_003496 [Aspergillus hiratsukae]|uniref:Zn(2)-C6 fungal-type domain-containing protein n=1 Tax=Aspergillus hiratsukae TaxID=1194566 RepID=A0A8H6UXR6_9EURO|nr:hypothetical protein CNMCM5793_003496 [Aspergillus hiratsukae]KAF7168104.1 hypothetical protein CNMCM6106_003430 [Aspergillus hiratsukae]